MKYMRAAPEVRFERLYIPEPNSGCWLWEGSVIDGGYGRFLFQSKAALAHRASYAMFCGDIPDGIQVLHRCDNPYCVNPGHLFLGNATDNMRDMVAKGRGKTQKGVDHPKAKLTPEKASEIRRRASNGERHAAIAASFGVTRSLVSTICRNEIWRAGSA